jgi:transcriptional regulator with XRE-family HTH domain
MVERMVNQVTVRRMIQRLQDGGYSQSSLAKMLGCGQSHVSNVVKARNGASVAMAMRIAEILGVPVDSVFGSDPDLEVVK